MGTKDPTLGTVPPIHKERIFVSYVLEISQGRNIKNLLRISVKSVQNYLRAPASHAANNGQREPCPQCARSVLPLEGAKPFYMLKKLFSHMSEWEDRRYKDLPLMADILRSLEDLLQPKTSNFSAHAFI